MTDKWKDRATTMRCISCMFFAPKTPTMAHEGDEDPPTIIGRCRRHAPTMNGYPVVYPKDWCGDHKLNENAIL